MSEAPPKLPTTYNQAVARFIETRCGHLDEEGRKAVECALSDAFAIGTAWTCEVALKLLADAVASQGALTVSAMRQALLSTADSVAQIRRDAVGNPAPVVMH